MPSKIVGGGMEILNYTFFPVSDLILIYCFYFSLDAENFHYCSFMKHVKESLDNFLFIKIMSFICFSLWILKNYFAKHTKVNFIVKYKYSSIEDDCLKTNLSTKILIIFAFCFYNCICYLFASIKQIISCQKKTKQIHTS